MRLLTGVGKPGQIGASLAAAFASQGDTLLLVGRRAQEAEARAQELRTNGADAFGYGADLTNAAELSELVNRIRREHGQSLNALVHAAGGFAMSGPVGESDVDAWDTQIAINLTTAYLTSRAFMQMLRSGRGSLVFFASEKALPGASVASASAYAVAKTGVVTLMRAIAAEEAPHGVRSNAVAPATVRTSSNVAAMGEAASYVELGAVADAVGFLCSPASAAVTGQLIRLK